jgi:hypothetical protein
VLKKFVVDRRDRHIRAGVASKGLAVQSLSGSKSFLDLFTCYSHHCPARPASGLRLEIAPNIDKKKSELYFPTPVKKILTENAKRHPKKSSSEHVDGVSALAHDLPPLGAKHAFLRHRKMNLRPTQPATRRKK